MIGQKGGVLTETLNLLVEDGENGLSVRDFLRRRGFSSSLIRRVKYGGIVRDGIPVFTTAALRTGDLLHIVLPEGKSENIEPIPLPLSLVYEDDDLLVVKKPIAMPTHPSRGNHLPTLANAVAAYFAPHPSSSVRLRGSTETPRDSC